MNGRGSKTKNEHLIAGEQKPEDEQDGKKNEAVENLDFKGAIDLFDCVSSRTILSSHAFQESSSLESIDAWRVLRKRVTGI